MNQIYTLTLLTSILASINLYLRTDIGQAFIRQNDKTNGLLSSAGSLHRDNTNHSQGFI